MPNIFKKRIINKKTKNTKIKGILLYFCIIFFIFNTKITNAVIPPDFIFSIGAQVAQFFSIIAMFFIAFFGAMYQFFKQKFYLLKYPKITISVIFVFIIIISLIISYLYAHNKQKGEYEKWLEESKKHEIFIDSESDENLEKFNDEELEAYQYEISLDKNDKLNIGDNENINIDISSEKFVSKIESDDLVSNFINKYYKNIAIQNLQEAYSMSKQSVDFSTFQNWYESVDKITLNKLVRIDNEKSSIELTLHEGDKFTRYGVLMTLKIQNDAPVKIEKSEVKILTEGLIKEKKIDMSSSEKVIDQEYSFFNVNKERNIMITNQDFKNITNGGRDDYIILDARENIEYENGHFNDSVHIRFADLKAGRWIEVPKDKYVYVLCWSGIRGKEVTEFLRTKKIVSFYLENGASGWVDFGGSWNGNIDFVEKYDDEKYKKVFTTSEIKQKVNEGKILVDSREPFKFEKSHIEGSFNIPIMHTPSIEIEKAFSQIPANSEVVTVCDGYVNCFDAKLAAIELENRGHKFLGRYNKPWEYEK